MSQVRALLDRLAAAGVLDAARADYMARSAGDDDVALLDALTRDFPGRRETVAREWEALNRIARVDLNTSLIDPRAVARLPPEVAAQVLAMPLYVLGNSLTVAMATPHVPATVDAVEDAAGMLVSPVFAFPDELRDAVSIHYQSESRLQDIGNEALRDIMRHAGREFLTVEQLEEAAGHEAVVHFVDGLLRLAVKEAASDVHVEPADDHVRIRFRIDGVLSERFRVDRNLLPALGSRLKIMANLDITEKRRPQDGRVTLEMNRRTVDFRLSTIPTIYGEKLVLRILGQTGIREIPDLEELGLSPHCLRDLQRIIGHPNGIFFVTGPTGSGKTTTLFSVLKRLNTPEVNIVTVEDPVEYRLEGVNQTQVNRAANMDFAAALRTFLRQDPDVILVGEVRDMETARVASQAALTGHLVLATMHTNDTFQAVTRLVEIGVEPFLVAPSIIGVLAQRLVRRLCSHCKERYRAPRELLDAMFHWDGKTEVHFHRPVGCARCNHIGYSGRVAIQELLVIDEETRRMVAQEASILDIRNHARGQGFRSLRHDGVKKALMGLTSLEEVDRVTLAD